MPPPSSIVLPSPSLLLLFPLAPLCFFPRRGKGIASPMGGGGAFSPLRGRKTKEGKTREEGRGKVKQ